jgi:hypothetical protein
MKTYTILIVTMLCFGTIQAQQKIEKHISFSGKENVELNIEIADSIYIQTWDKNEVFVSASININNNKDNQAYETTFGEAGNTVTVNASFKKDYFKGCNNCCNKTDIYWQVFVPEKTDIKIETINADLTIKGETGSMNLKSISGSIDLAIPASRPADLDFSTISGTIYSNLDLTAEKMKSSVPVEIKGKLNNGGSEIKLKTISGDIFFRKSD